MKKTKKKMKPIRTLIEIYIYSWFDKTYGNTYCSARVYVNKDYDAPVIIPFSSCGTSYCEAIALRAVGQKYKGLAGLEKLGYSERNDKGIHVNVAIREVNKIECKRWGNNANN